VKSLPKPLISYIIPAGGSASGRQQLIPFWLILGNTNRTDGTYDLSVETNQD